MTGSFLIIWQHLRLTLRLFRQNGALFMAIVAAGGLAGHLLLRLAVEIGMHSRLLGLFALTPVILLEMVIAVGMFLILRRGLPGLRHRGNVQETVTAGSPDAQAGGMFPTALLAVLIPFYGYYAGWGLLSDTLRSYSQIFYTEQIARIDFTNPQHSPAALDIGQTGWVIMAVMFVWVIRRFSKYKQTHSAAAFWPMLVVICEAGWALLGLYVIAGWKDQLTGWLATLPSPAELLEQIVTPAHAAITAANIRPVD